MQKEIRFPLLILCSAIVLFLSTHSCASPLADKNTLTDCDSVIDKSKLNGASYKLFLGSPVCELAISLFKEHDTSNISQIVLANNLDVNFREPKYGMTLLMQSVMLGEYAGCCALLKAGADPNVKNTSTGVSSMIYACNIHDDSLKILRLLLQYGGRVNDTMNTKTTSNNEAGTSSLLTACSIGAFDTVISLDRVQLLLDSGADVNYINEKGDSPLGKAVIMGRYDIALVLLEHGADYNVPMLKQEGFPDQHIVDLMRKAILPLDSKQYRYKMKVVDFLSVRGVNYTDAPIPPYVMDNIKATYPNDWREYSEKY